MTIRIPAKEITGLYGALIKTFSKKMFGRVPESLGVMWHNRAVLTSSMGFGRNHAIRATARSIPPISMMIRLAAGAISRKSHCNRRRVRNSIR